MTAVQYIVQGASKFRFRNGKQQNRDFTYSYYGYLSSVCLWQIAGPSIILKMKKNFVYVTEGRFKLKRRFHSGFSISQQLFIYFGLMFIFSVMYNSTIKGLSHFHVTMIHITFCIVH